MWTRPAADGDLTGIAGVDPAVDSDADRRALIVRAIAEESCWIAGRQDLPEGYLVLSRRHFFGRDFVSLLAVKAAARRQGMASALFHLAETSAATPQLFTSTNQSNHPMRALLDTRSYLAAGVIDHLDPGDPEIVFVRYLR